MTTTQRCSYILLFMMFSTFIFATPALAATPQVVTGAKALAQDALMWILILVPITAGAMIGWHAWMKSMADGEQGEMGERNKKMKNVLVAAIIAESAAGIVQVILSYFT